MDDLIAEARKALEDVTPGPWHTHPVDDTAIISSDGTDVGTTCDSAKAERDDAYNNNYEQMEADAHFIAWCREGVPALLDALEKAQAKLERMEAALVEHNDLMRSVFAIAEREGVKGMVASTNWDAFYNRVAVLLKKHHALGNEARAALQGEG